MDSDNTNNDLQTYNLSHIPLAFQAVTSTAKLRARNERASAKLVELDLVIYEDERPQKMKSNK